MDGWEDRQDEHGKHKDPRLDRVGLVRWIIDLWLIEPNNQAYSSNHDPILLYNLICHYVVYL